jgi:hypothetical protein
MEMQVGSESKGQLDSILESEESNVSSDFRIIFEFDILTELEFVIESQGLESYYFVTPPKL